MATPLNPFQTDSQSPVKPLKPHTTKTFTPSIDTKVQKTRKHSSDTSSKDQSTSLDSQSDTKSECCGCGGTKCAEKKKQQVDPLKQDEIDNSTGPRSGGEQRRRGSDESLIEIEFEGVSSNMSLETDMNKVSHQVSVRQLKW